MLSKILSITLITIIPFQLIFGQTIDSINIKLSGRYLSDIDSSYALLERIQKKAYDDALEIRHFKPPRKKDLILLSSIYSEMSYYMDDSVSEELKLMRKKYSDNQHENAKKRVSEFAKMNLPTRYENANWYSLVSKLNNRLLTVIAKEYPNFKSRVLIGTIPTTSVNAVTIKVPRSTDRIVLFNEDLFQATYDLTKVLIQTFDWKENRLSYYREKVLQHTKEPEINNRFVKTMSWYLNMPSTYSGTESYFLEPGPMSIAMALTRSMEIFALAHEYAHIILNHTPQNANECVNSWKQEFEADKLGFELMLMTIMESGNQTEQIVGRWGAMLMLNNMDIFERGTITSFTGKIPPEVDSLELNMIKGVFTCLKSPDGKPCKKFLRSGETKTSHPPMWFRYYNMRIIMKEEPTLSQIMSDEWDFGQAFIVGGHALLLDNSSSLILKK